MGELVIPEKITKTYGTHGLIKNLNENQIQNKAFFF